MKKIINMKLEDVLWTTILWVCVLFYAFAAGVWAAERAEEPEPAEVESIQAAPVMVAISMPATEEAPAVLDPMVEDTYLRDDVPLSYELQAALYGACLEFQVDYAVMLALVDRETDFRNVTGDDGASQGYCQIQRKWWSGLMAEIGAEDLTDPEDNFRTACAIVAQLTERYGSLGDALTAYNRGTPGSSDYSRSILASAETWR